MVSSLSYASTKKVASTEALESYDPQVIIDNDEAFRSKLNAIENAKTSIDMIYYIYSNDYSSAVITKKLMEKARSGVKVRLMLDYLTNLKNSDLLLAMQKSGIEIKLYNKPTENIKRDAVYITSPCPDKAQGNLCVSLKDKKSSDLLKNGNGTDFMSRLFLTGLYAKNINLLKISVIEGQEVNLEALKASQGNSTEAERNQLKEFAKLFVQAKVRGDIDAKFKLWLAFSVHGEQITPIYNLITESLPFISQGTNTKDWAHLTDYTHHKLLLVDNTYMQLGGRNIEDSYHMKTNDVYSGKNKKYIFMDTDFASTVSKKSGAEIKSTFDNLWNLSWMVSDLKEVDATLELDSLARMDLLGKALQVCKGQSQSSNVENQTRRTCLERQYRLISSADPYGRPQRLAKVESAINNFANLYYKNHKANLGEADVINNQSGRFSDLDKKKSKIYYIENLPYARPGWSDKLAGKAEPTRQYGADLHNEYQSNKNIHELLVRGLENVCHTQDPSVSKEIILHNAYFFPPPSVMRAFGKMMTGEWACGGVTVIILTNSYETTDLFPVNAVASTQFKALFTTNAEELRKGHGRSAKFRLLEYKRQSHGDERSLHSKVSLLGNDLIVGSANMDIRSYAMDTNNGVYIENAKDLAKDYRDFVNTIISSEIRDENNQVKFVIQDRTEEMSETEITKKQFVDQQISILQYAISQYGLGRKLIGDQADPVKRQQYLEMLSGVMNFIYDTTLSGLDHRRIEPLIRGVKSGKELERFQKSEQLRLEYMIQNLLSVI